jgi:hypothetical protein
MPVIRSCIVTAVSVVLVGCTTYQPIAERKDLVSAADAGGDMSIAVGDSVRLTRVDGTATKLKVAAVTAEAIEGVPTGKRSSVSVPFSDIERVERLQVSKSGTRRAFWIAAGVVVAGFIGAKALEDGVQDTVRDIADGK